MTVCELIGLYSLETGWGGGIKGEGSWTIPDFVNYEFLHELVKSESDMILAGAQHYARHWRMYIRRWVVWGRNFRQQWASWIKCDNLVVFAWPFKIYAMYRKLSGIEVLCSQFSNRLVTKSKKSWIYWSYSLNRLILIKNTTSFSLRLIMFKIY